MTMARKRTRSGSFKVTPFKFTKPRSNYKKRPSYRRRYKKGGSSFAKAVKKVILKTAEKKYKTAELLCNSAYDATFGGFALNHNSTVNFHMIDNTAPTVRHVTYIGQGDSDGARNGDEIYAKGIMLRATIAIPADRKNIKVRMFLVEHNSVQGDLAVYGDLYHNITGRNVLDPIQSDRWKMSVIGDYEYKSSDTSSDPITGQRGSILIKKWIPFRRHLRYEKDDSFVVTRGMKERLSVVLQTWDNNSTFDSSTCGYIRGSITLHYGDP